MNPFITFTPRNNIQCCIRLAQDFDKNPVVTVQPQPRRRVDRARFKIPTKWDGQKWQQGGEACASRQMWQIRQKGIRESCFQEKTWRFLFGKNYRNTWHYEVSWSGHTFIRRDSCFAWWDSKTFAYRQRLATPQPAWLELQVLELSGSNGQSWKRLQMFCRENLQKSTQNWRPLLAFTPFAGYKRRCERPNYVTFVRSAYAFGLRMAPDQAVHLTRTKDTSLVAQTKRIEHLYQKHRIALAFSEYLHAETLKFPTEVVEADSARFGSGYECGKRIHSGRMLVLKGRQSKQWSSQPLPVKVSKGKRGMGPETVQEVSGPIQKQTPASALLGVDGGKAWKKAAEGRIVLRGVSHQTKIFTPASKVSKQKLPAKTKKFLEKQSNGKRKGARMYQRHFRVAGGDNCAEGIFGHLANIMRKTNSRGRHAKPQMRTLQAQSSAALLRRPGFLNVLLAHAKYKEALLTGRLGVSPNQAYNFHQCWWLHPKEDKEASEWQL